MPTPINNDNALPGVGVIPGTRRTNLGKESGADATSFTGITDTGVLALGIVNTDGNTLGGDGAYAPFAVTNQGSMLVTPGPDGFPVSISGSLELFTTADNAAFVAPATGPQVTMAKSCKYWALQVTGVLGVATVWTVVLEVTLDQVNYSTILSHTNVTGNGVVLQTTLPFVGKQVRLRCTALTLGPAAAINCFYQGNS